MTSVRVLGVAQDAGVPHVGCSCARCERFRDAPLLPACLGLVGKSGYLIDATPALPEQLRMLGAPLGGVLLTHMHMGHIAGLLQLGPEALAPDACPLYATQGVLDALERSAPWGLLFRKGHLDPHPIEPGFNEPGAAVELEPGLTVEAIEVAHRNEYADTVGYYITGPARTILYIPDVDVWIDLPALLERCDLALLDGSFYTDDELPNQEQVPHPSIQSTLAQLTDEQAAKVRFTHFNHTNPVLDEDGPTVLAAVQGDEISLT